MNRKNNLLAKISFNINFIVIYCLLFLAVWIYSFIFYPRITASINNPENTLFFNRIISLLGENYILQGIIALGLTILAGTFAFLLNERFSFSPKQSYFPFFFFTLFIAITKKSLFITPGLIAVIFFIFGIYLFFKTYQNKDSVIALNLFLTLSIGSLFFFDLLYYALLFVIGLINFQSLNLRTFLASIIGLITPYLFIISIFYLNDSISTLTTNIDYINNWNFILYNYSLSEKVYVIIFTLLSIFSVLSCLFNLGYEKIKRRKFILFLIISLLLSAILSLFHKENLIISFLLGCLLLSRSFTSINNKFSLILFFGWIITCISFLILH